jgi:hypothetical protein
MFDFLKRGPKVVKRTPEEKQRRFNELLRQLVPPSYEADTLQGELIRCIGNLSDEAKRNGNMNWDENDEEAVEFLRVALADKKIFDATRLKKIESDLSVILKAGQSTEDNFCTAYEELDRIADCVIEFCDMYPDPIRLKEPDEYLGHF